MQDLRNFCWKVLEERGRAIHDPGISKGIDWELAGESDPSSVSIDIVVHEWLLIDDKARLFSMLPSMSGSYT